MWFKLICAIVLFFSFSTHLISSTEFDNCCRYGFEDGIKLNMLRENRNWSVIRTPNFNYCEVGVLFGEKAFRACKKIGEEMALNCHIGKYYSLLDVNCDNLKDENPSAYGCCMTCSNGRKFGEGLFDLLENKTSKHGDYLFEDKNLYKNLIDKISLKLENECESLNLVYLTPDLQFSTFRQCCRSWTYNNNQNFYPDHFQLSDTCERIDVCLRKQNHTQFDFNGIKNQDDLARLKTENVLKIIHEQMKLENKQFINELDDVILKKDDPLAKDDHGKSIELNLLKDNSTSLAKDFHRYKLRSLEDEKKFHPNISTYELQIRRVPMDKFRYYYCNRQCLDNTKDYNELVDVNQLNSQKRKEFTQCFHNYAKQFCAKPIKCSNGFIPNHNNTVCIELNECELNLDDCPKESEECVNHSDGYTCECRIGFRYDLGEKRCLNFNECLENKNLCPHNSYCVDLEGAYECKCYEGLFKDELGRCSPFMNKNSQAKKPPQTNEEENILHFTDKQPSTEISVDEEVKLLAEKLKFERENLEKLKKGQLPNGKFLSEDKEFENLDKENQLTNRELAKEPSNEESSRTPKSTDKTIEPLMKTTTESNQISSENEKLEEEKKRLEDEKKRLEEENKRLEEENRKLEEEKRRLEEQEINRMQVNEQPRASSVRSNANEIDNNPRTIIGLGSSNETEEVPEFPVYNPCPLGYDLTESSPRRCVDIDECSNSTLNNCGQNQTCINLPGRYECKAKDDCPKEYKDINLNLITNSNSDLHHHEQQTTRTSTYCKITYKQEFESDEERLKYEKKNSIIQYIAFDTITLPFSDITDYEMVNKDKLLEKVDGQGTQRLKKTGIIIYVIDKSLSKEKYDLDFVGDLRIKSTNCTENNLNNYFNLTELSSNMFTIVLVDSIKESCTIDFELEIQSKDLKEDSLDGGKMDDYTKFTTQKNINYNHELYNVHLIIYQYKLDFTLKGNLRS